MLKVVVLLALAASCSAQVAAGGSDWQLHLLNTTYAQQRGALCLDGSPPGESWTTLALPDLSVHCTPEAAGLGF